MHSYIEEKAQEQAERVALAELAAERREQKTLEFVGNRLKASVGNRPSTSSNSDALSSLFDRATGKPRNDCNPLPETSRSYWHGFLALAQKLGQLREALVERAEEKRQHAKEAQATTTIQRHWRVRGGVGGGTARAVTPRSTRSFGHSYRNFLPSPPGRGKETTLVTLGTELAWRPAPQRPACIAPQRCRPCIGCASAPTAGF